LRHGGRNDIGLESTVISTKVERRLAEASNRIHGGDDSGFRE